MTARSTGSAESKPRRRPKTSAEQAFWPRGFGGAGQRRARHTQRSTRSGRRSRRAPARQRVRRTPHRDPKRTTAAAVRRRWGAGPSGPRPSVHDVAPRATPLPPGSGQAAVSEAVRKSKRQQDSARRPNGTFVARNLTAPDVDKDDVAALRTDQASSAGATFPGSREVLWGAQAHELVGHPAMMSIRSTPFWTSPQ